MSFRTIRLTHCSLSHFVRQQRIQNYLKSQEKISSSWVKSLYSFLTIPKTRITQCRKSPKVYTTLVLCASIISSTYPYSWRGFLTFQLSPFHTIRVILNILLNGCNLSREIQTSGQTLNSLHRFLRGSVKNRL